MWSMDAVGLMTVVWWAVEVGEWLIIISAVLEDDGDEDVGFLETTGDDADGDDVTTLLPIYSVSP